MAEKSTLLCKVCGMTDTDNILAVSALQPDLMGFIFYRESKRYVGEQFIVPKNLPARISRVGVFVNQHVEDILSLVRKHGLQYVQLHGDELPGQCAFLREHGCRVIKAFGVGDGFS
ncbi:MAG: phosphoribosylanthranilate isomerase, partial [Bacteroidetes bacterium]|nr:phosphoribosylanthranilate isomerase [Bacteroidota bacterium]